MTKRLHFGVSARASNRGMPFAMRPGFSASPLNAGGCLWIEGEDFLEQIRAGGDPHCGATRADDGPYCAKHRRRAFVRPHGPVRAPWGGENDGDLQPGFRGIMAQVSETTRCTRGRK